MKNAPTNDKSCTYCGATGHTSRTCVVKKAGLPSPVAIAKEQAKLAKIAEREAAVAAKTAAKAAKIAGWLSAIGGFIVIVLEIISKL